MTTPGRPGGAGATVVAAVAAIALELADAAADAVRDEPDAVHHARTLVRRLRSVLKAYGGLFEHDDVERLRDELAELGNELGAARDLEVRVQQAEERLGEDADPPVRRRLVDEPTERYAERHARLVAYLAGRGSEVQRRLTDFVGDPPFVEDAGEAAETAIARMIRAEVKRVRRARRRAAGDLASLHRLRRAVRRLRYAVEAVSSPPAAVFGEEMRHLADSAQTVQDILGEHRDEMLFAEQLRAAGRDARAEGEGSDGYEVLAAGAYSSATAGLTELTDALRELRKRWRTVTA